MKSKFLPLSLAAAILFTISALAQTSSAATPSGPGAGASGAAPALPVATGSGTRLGTINIEQAIFGSNEGRRDFEALSKKLEPKQNELKSKNEELESLQKQMQTQGDKLNPDAHEALLKQIETKKKAFDRDVQDAQENGFGMVVDTTKPWPQSSVLWYDGDKVDITKPIIEAYNAQSGVPAPAAGAAAPKPTSTKP